MSTFPIEIAGIACVVHYTAKVTCEAQRATGPTYSCGGEPATAMEFEVEVDGLWTDPTLCPICRGNSFIETWEFGQAGFTGAHISSVMCHACLGRKTDAVKQLELPDWLCNALIAQIQDDDSVYEEVADDHAAEKYGDPDEAYERRRDDPPPRGWDD